MIELKRFTRPGVVISVIGHGAALMLGLLFVVANPVASAPPDATPPPPPPDSMVVDIVPQDQAPRFEGAPVDSTSSGAEQPANSDSVSPPQPPVPQPTPQPQ
jgi:hypothetical protein